MTVTIFSDSLKSVKGLGLFQFAVGFGRPFDSERGRLIRFTVQTWAHWMNSAERGYGRNMDNYSEGFAGALRGFHIWKVFTFRHYYRIATHVSIGPFTLSFVRGTWGPTAHRLTVSLA